jgi:hypothetical protein
LARANSSGDVFFGGVGNKGQLPCIQSATPIDRPWLAS